jgi:hypothetical protein
MHFDWAGCFWWCFFQGVIWESMLYIQREAGESFIISIIMKIAVVATKTSGNVDIRYDPWLFAAPIENA